MDMFEKVYITQPILPNLDDFNEQLKDIWKSKWLTNHGIKHNELEEKVKKTLKVKNLSLFNNGTIALLVALRAMDLPFGSEVITTPFTFAATPHCISWNGQKPVFCDIEPDTMCIDADKIESLITENTSAILGVHVYGFPCNVKKIDKIAKKYNLKVIYDAAHAFSTEIDSKGIGTFGDITMFSFHATKLYNTIEGGCLTYSNPELKERIYNLRNFGIRGEDEVTEIGINGKMNELQAAIGLLNLNLYKKEQEKREILRKRYIVEISKIKGIKIPQMPEGSTNSYQYFPIIIEQEYSLSRNELYEKFKKHNIITRKYFYPLCSDYEPYKYLKSSRSINLQVANKIKEKVLCLPFYGGLKQENFDTIIKIMKGVKYCD